MFRTLAACTAVVAVAAAAPRVSPNPMLESGVSFALAEDRAHRISDLRYDLRFSIPASPAEPVTGEATLAFDLSDASRPLVLDFLPSAAGVSAPRSRSNRRPSISSSRRSIFGRAPIAITIAFTAPDAALNRNDGVHVHAVRPGAGPHGVPVLRPAGPQGAIHADAGNPGRMGGRRQRGGTSRSAPRESGRRDAAFAETEPIPTYLFAFAAGSSRSSAPSAGRTFRMLHRETDAEEGGAQPRRHLRPACLGARVARTVHRIPYPFPKFDFVLIPSFQFGGMEHPGAIFYNARRSCSTSPRRATRNSGARASSPTRPPTCGSAISSRCAGSTTCG
jgi:aminopeptidase N